MANLSWLYYKGYHNSFNDWDNRKSDKEAIKKRIEAFFSRKNEVFWNYKLPPQENIGGDILFTTTYPGLLIGSGYTHEIGAIGESKIGFQLDHTTGLPIIPGSSVKGAIRSAFPQFEPHPERPWEIKEPEKTSEISREKANYIARLKEWQYDQPAALYEAVHQLEMQVFEGLDIEKSIEASKPVYQSIYKRFIFYDALPKKAGENGKLFGPDAITPHTAGPLKNPIPLLFLKVLPNVTYAFRFGTISMLACYASSIDETVKLLANVLSNTGIGAKTNVGYGALNFEIACYDCSHTNYTAIKATKMINIPPRRTNTNEA